jgi:hypothetical protein
VLRTRDRDTWLGGGSAVTVLDGARQELREGLVMVDARRGPALLLTTPAALVTTPEGAVSRVEGGPLLRVGAYEGDPLRVQPAGRRATTPVARDYQVQVPVGALPGRVTPLVLTPGDAYERALAPQLVGADEALLDLGRRLDMGGEPAAVVRLAADTDVPTVTVPTEAAVPVGAPASERTLAYLLARVASSDGSLDARYAAVRSLRGDGGSWGVVADLVRADVPQVAGLLDVLLAPDGVALVVGEPDVPTLFEVLFPTPGAAPVAAEPGTSAQPGPAPAPAPAPESPAAPPPTQPDPPAEPGPVPPTGTVVDTVVDTVVKLLPPVPVTTTPAPVGDEPAPAGALLPLLSP